MAINSSGRYVETGQKHAIDIIVPFYNEEEGIGDFLECLQRITSNIGDNLDFTIICVDDGSNDDSWKIIIEYGEKYRNIRGLSFSRNFGKEAAILAGLRNSTGDAAITIDADFQHPPALIPEFINKWREGAVKIVEGVKKSRGKESFMHRSMSHLFYKSMNKAMKMDMTNYSDYKLLDREVVELISNMHEKRFFYRAMTPWMGMPSAIVEFEVAERKKGKTKWSADRLLRYAINNLTSYTTVPLYITILIGIFFTALSVIIGGITVFKWLFGQAVEGFTTVILLELIIGGLILISLGIIGYYISKVFDQVQDRPRYILAKQFDSREESQVI